MSLSATGTVTISGSIPFPNLKREIHNGDRRFIVQIAPCSSSDGHVDSAVLTFTNVTAFRASIGQAVYEREYTKAILNTVIDPLEFIATSLG